MKSGKGFYVYEKGKAGAPSTEAQALKGGASSALSDATGVGERPAPTM